MKRPPAAAVIKVSNVTHVREIELAKVDKKSLAAYLKRASIKNGGDTPDSLVTAYMNFYDKLVDDESSGDEFLMCEGDEGCGAPFETGLDECPVCGLEAVESTAVSRREADDELAKSIVEIRGMIGEAFAGYWRLGQALLDNYKRSLYKKALGKDGKRVYPSWNEFTTREFKIPGRTARDIMAVSDTFDQEQVAKLGVDRLTLVLKAPEAKREKVLEQAEKLTTRELRDLVKKGGRPPLSDKGEGRGAAKARAALAAKKAEEREKQATDRREQAEDGSRVTCVFEMGEVELPLHQKSLNSLQVAEDLINGVRVTYVISLGKKPTLKIRRERISV